MAEAYFLASIGGFVDAFGILTLGGLFVAHMSGNSAAMGAAFGQANWAEGMPHLVAVPIFVLGLFVGYALMLRSPGYRRCAMILIFEALLLASFGLGMAWLGAGARNSAQYFAMAALPLFAMGLQNATLREIGHSAFATTYMTGVLDAMAKAAARWIVKSPAGSEQDVLIARQAAAMWLSYVVGAIAGSAGQLTLHYEILVIPVVILLVIAGRFLALGGAINQPPNAP
jgi:uncharacterized membrane protein YoaK (UPF0700 family)